MAVTREQQQLALALFDAGMSTRGAAQARWSIALDDILREHERAAGHVIASESWRDVEYDNTQNNSNHIHSVWRKVTGDWGEDLLAEHYAASHV
jgi:hypothetical protein